MLEGDVAGRKTRVLFCGTGAVSLPRDAIAAFQVASQWAYWLHGLPGSAQRRGIAVRLGQSVAVQRQRHGVCQSACRRACRYCHQQSFDIS